MSLSDYLAKNYLSDPKKKSKKQKKEKKEKQEKTVIVDNQAPLKNDEIIEEVNDPADELPETIEPPKKKLKPKGWKIVGTDEIVPELPQVEEHEDVKMSSGAKAGLQTAEQVSSQIKEKEEKERQEMEAQRALNSEANNKTIYRDKSGRKIDMEKKRAEDLAKEEEQEQIKKIEHRKRNMGLVQLLDIQESKDKLAKASTSGITRYAHDEELNSELKKRELEDDPLLSFNPSKSKKYISRTGRKLYKGGFPENRFGIVPGWRWDGVDRSNGFEKSWFKKQEEVQKRKTLSYTMQEDY